MNYIMPSQPLALKVCYGCVTPTFAYANNKGLLFGIVVSDSICVCYNSLYAGLHCQLHTSPTDNWLLDYVCMVTKVDFTSIFVSTASYLPCKHVVVIHNQLSVT